MLGRAAVAIWFDVAAAMQREVEDWHSHEHMPERLAIAGFLRGSRWIAVSGKPSYFVLYEAASLGAITGSAYLARLNKPTPWSRKMMPQHRNMVRGVCRVRARYGRGLGHALATVRFSPARSTSLRQWLRADALPRLCARKGLTSAHLLESQPMPQRQSVEQKIRGGDAAADWVLLVGGYDADAVRRVVNNELGAGALTRHGAAPGAVASVYRLAYSLNAHE